MAFETKRVGDVIDEIAMGPFGSNIKVDCFVPSGVPVLNGSNLTGFTLTEETFNYVTPEKAASLKRAVASRGDVVITHRGTLGQIVYIPTDSKHEKYVISQSQFRVRCKDTEMLPEFMVYFFHSREGQHELLSNSSQVGVPALARPSTTFQELEMPVPTIEEQQGIVDTLSTLDARIAENRKINHHLEQMAQAIFKSWFVDFEPFGGEQPSDWKEGTVGDVVRLQRGHDLPVNSVTDGKYPVVGSKGIIAYHNVFTSPAPVIVMGRSGNIGMPRYYNMDCWAHNTAIYSKEIFGAPLWVYYTLAQIDYSIFKGGSAVPTLNRNHVESFDILIPPVSVQQSFHDTIEPLFRQRDALDNESACLSETRDTLLPRLMSGELSVASVDAK